VFSSCCFLSVWSAGLYEFGGFLHQPFQAFVLFVLCFVLSEFDEAAAQAGALCGEPIHERQNEVGRLWLFGGGL